MGEDWKAGAGKWRAKSRMGLHSHTTSWPKVVDLEFLGTLACVLEPRVGKNFAVYVLQQTRRLPFRFPVCFTLLLQQEEYSSFWVSENNMTKRRDC